MSDIKLPPMPNNLMNVLRRIRLCEGETAALLVFEHSLIAYARAAVELNCSAATVPDAIISGSLFDFAGFLTTLDTPVRFGSTEEASPMVKLIQEVAKKRGLSLDDADVLSWSSVLASAPPVAQPACQHVPEVHFGNTMKPETLRSELQKKCSAWGAYWRGSDAHGVELTSDQAVELLENALNVEVEIKDEEPEQAQPAEHKPLAESIDPLTCDIRKVRYMNIYSPPGAQVIFHGRGGYDSEKEHAKKTLTLGVIYEVERTNVGHSSSNVRLRGIAKAAEEFSGKIAELEAQLLEARKDAERYRRLRAKLVDRSSSGLSHWVCSINAMDELDAAIDAAISKEREK